MKRRNNIIIFFLVSLSFNFAFAADLFSELTGEAARSRTAEARAARDQINNELNAVNSQNKMRSEELANLQVSLQNSVNMRNAWLETIRSGIGQQLEKNEFIQSEIANELDLIMRNEKDLQELSTIFDVFRDASRRIARGAEASVQIAQFIERSDISLVQWSKAFIKLHEISGDNPALRANSFALFKSIASQGVLKGKELLVIGVEKAAMEFLKNVNIEAIERASLNLKNIKQISEDQRRKTQASLDGLRESRIQMQQVLLYLEGGIKK